MSVDFVVQDSGRAMWSHKTRIFVADADPDTLFYITDLEELKLDEIVRAKIQGRYSDAPDQLGSVPFSAYIINPALMFRENDIRNINGIDLAVRVRTSQGGNQGNVCLVSNNVSMLYAARDLGFQNLFSKNNAFGFNDMAKLVHYVKVVLGCK
ncbi:hypothetical protein HYS31_00925 [Candidatus Woesearchaeota archaeon]|nr:hypothetical protein [Candidatus Woesearchaeota archaeon]